MGPKSPREKDDFFEEMAKLEFAGLFDDDDDHKYNYSRFTDSTKQSAQANKESETQNTPQMPDLDEESRRIQARQEEIKKWGEQILVRKKVLEESKLALRSREEAIKNQQRDLEAKESILQKSQT